MTRTIITISEGDKAWLDHYSRLEHASVAEIIRQAIKMYKTTVEQKNKKSLIKQTAGLWKSKNIDALDYVKHIRKEWD